MNKIAVALALLSSTAFAAAKNPASTGQFRRAEAIEAAGANPKTARVHSLTTANHRTYVQTQERATARHAFVVDGNKVTLVTQPLDRAKPVVRTSAREANAMGLKTQGQARVLARHNAGEYGTKGRVEVADAGFGAKEGSYLFKQVSPATITIKNWEGKPVNVSNIVRSVSVTGKGQSVASSQ
jgi:hypothetical protein